MFNKKEIWLDGRMIPLERTDLWTLVHNAPYRRVVFSPEQWRQGRHPARFEPILEIIDRDDLQAVTGGEIVLSTEPELLSAAREKGCRTCIELSIEGAEALERACTEVGKYDFAVVRFDLPTFIPLELLLARLQHSQTALLCSVDSIGRSQVAFGVLERGSDGVLLQTDDPEELRNGWRDPMTCEGEKWKITAMTVEEARYAGMGWRACIDTTGLMTREEGMLVGSTSNGGIFVCSETHYLPYMNLRPFRVNAGAVHSYIWRPDGSTQYITELAAGSEVLCLDINGRPRGLIVGRVKMEVRPLLLIKGTVDGRELNVIVQDDWHIRIMGADGRPRNATALQPGDGVLAHICDPGRHVGLPVDEMVIEK